MPPESDEARFRDHVKLLRQATRGIGKDIEIEFKDVEKDIARLPHTIGRDYDNLREEIDFKILRLSIKAHKFKQEFPKEVKADFKKAGHAAKSGVKFAGEAIVVETARGAKAVKRHSQQGLAKAAGTYHAPLNEWDRSSGGSS